LRVCHKNYGGYENKKDEDHDRSAGFGAGNRAGLLPHAGGGGDPTSASYTSYDAVGNAYRLTVSQGSGRAAYSPQSGDSYTLTITSPSGKTLGTSSGTVTSFDGGTLKVKEKAGEQFQVQISGSAITSIPGNSIPLSSGSSEHAVIAGGLSPSKPSPPRSKPKLGVAIRSSDFTEKCAEFMKKNGMDTWSSIDVMSVDGNGSQSDQNNQVQNIISKVNVIAVNLIKEDEGQEIVTMANGIPVVFFGRKPNDSVLSAAKVYYVDYDQAVIGTMQGQIVRDWWNANKSTADRNTNGKMDYLMLKGNEISSPDMVQKRTTYSIKAITDDGIAVQKLAEADAGFDWNTAKNQMSTWWSSHGSNVDVVFCNNDSMALGVIDFLNSVSGSKPVVVGVDAIADALDAIADGTLLGTVLQVPNDMAQTTLDYTCALANNSISSGERILRPKPVTKDNYKQFQPPSTPHPRIDSLRGHDRRMNSPPA
jgi:methyl-galactoside transport system substrate-binding protein